MYAENGVKYVNVVCKQTLAFKWLLFAWQMFESHKTLLKYICFCCFCCCCGCYSWCLCSFSLLLFITSLSILCMTATLSFWTVGECERSFKCEWLKPLYGPHGIFESCCVLCGVRCDWASAAYVWNSHNSLLRRLIAHVFVTIVASHFAFERNKT